MIEPLERPDWTWSAYAHTVLRVFAPWQPQDGLPISEISTATARLGVSLPTTLTKFYQSWGNNLNLTQRASWLFLPAELTIVDDILVFAAEEQGVWQWGIRVAALDEINPPVVYAYTAQDPHGWRLSHRSLSAFLDYFATAHAFAGGALHGAYATDWRDSAISENLSRLYPSIELPTYPAGWIPDQPRQTWTLFIGADCLICPFARVAIVAAGPMHIDALGDQLGCAWKTRW
jgi:hypothetical protein